MQNSLQQNLNIYPHFLSFHNTSWDGASGWKHYLWKSEPTKDFEYILPDQTASFTMTNRILQNVPALQVLIDWTDLFTNFDITGYWKWGSACN